MVRSLIAYDPRKMARYALAAHIVQFPMIMPFYTTAPRGRGVERARRSGSHARAVGTTRCGWTSGANCFPSMHTSVAFAILLLALRERSTLFRWGMAAYAASIIFSTVYMEIHWVADIGGGLLLGAVAVKVVDAAMARWNSSRPAS